VCLPEKTRFARLASASPGVEEAAAAEQYHQNHDENDHFSRHAELYGWLWLRAMGRSPHKPVFNVAEWGRLIQLLTREHFYHVDSREDLSLAQSFRSTT
jgi:hypothetical protein